MITIIKDSNLEELFKRSAKLLVSEIIKLNGKNNKIVIGLPGGRSIVGLFDAIATSSNFTKPEIWSKTLIFLVDDRLVDITSEDSNTRLVQESLIKKLIVKKALTKLNARSNFYGFKYDSKKKDKGCKEYNKEFFSKAKGFDILFLGVGEDNHVAALYPNHHSIKFLGKQYFTMNDSPKMPKDRMSASRKMIEDTKVIFLLFIGEGKKQALKNFLDPKMSVENCPAKMALKANKTYLITDINLN